MKVFFEKDYNNLIYLIIHSIVSLSATKRGTSHEGKKIGLQSSTVGSWKSYLGLGEKKATQC